MEAVSEGEFNYSIRTTLRNFAESFDITDILVNRFGSDTTELGDVEKQPSLIESRMFVIPGSHRTSVSDSRMARIKSSFESYSHRPEV